MAQVLCNASLSAGGGIQEEHRPGQMCPRLFLGNRFLFGRLPMFSVKEVQERVAVLSASSPLVFGSAKARRSTATVKRTACLGTFVEKSCISKSKPTQQPQSKLVTRASSAAGASDTAVLEAS